jgi:hypothetical protein
MNEKDEAMLKAVKAFNPYDLYSKSDDVPSVEELKVRLFFLLIGIELKLITTAILPRVDRRVLSQQGDQVVDALRVMHLFYESRSKSVF